MNDFEQEWLVPEPVMTNKEKIILNLISLGEFFQWLVVGGLFYLFLTFVPLDLIFKSFLAVYFWALALVLSIYHSMG